MNKTPSEMVAVVGNIDPDAYAPVAAWDRQPDRLNAH